jgi:hypothetical protein
MSQIEKGTPWQNRTEVKIREIKRHIRRLMDRTKLYPQLWDFCMTYMVELCNRLVRPLNTLKGRRPSGYSLEIHQIFRNNWNLTGFNPCGIMSPICFHNKTSIWRDGLELLIESDNPCVSGCYKSQESQ